MTTSDAVPGDYFHCRIFDIEGALFTAACINPDGVELHADFEVASLPADRPLRVGDVFFAPSMKIVDLGRWTEEEINEIKAEAASRWAALQDLID